MIPFVYERFMSTDICRDCSMEFHKEIYKFAEEFINNVKED